MGFKVNGVLAAWAGEMKVEVEVGGRLKIEE